MATPNIPDAIAAARRDVEFLEKEWGHDCDCPDDPGFRGAHGKDCPWMRWVNGEDDVRARLAALGPPSVALAEVLWELNEAVKKYGLFLNMRTADKALAVWADAQHGAG